MNNHKAGRQNKRKRVTGFFPAPGSILTAILTNIFIPDHFLSP